MGMKARKKPTMDRKVRISLAKSIEGLADAIELKSGDIAQFGWAIGLIQDSALQLNRGFLELGEVVEETINAYAVATKGGEKVITSALAHILTGAVADGNLALSVGESVTIKATRPSKTVWELRRVK